MNTQILQKCIDKLSQDKPNIPYVLGMLETLKEMGEVSPNMNLGSAGSVSPSLTALGASRTLSPVEVMSDEEKEYYALMARGSVAPMRDGGGE